MEAPSNQIRELYAKASAGEKQHIQEQLRDLQNELSTDWEVLFGIGMRPLQWVLANIGIDLNIFTTLASSDEPVTHASLIKTTGCAPNLLCHLLRGMASFGLITEVSKDTFTANRVTRTFMNPHVAGAAPHISDMHFPVMNVFAKYLKEHGYKDMTDTKDLPFHKALNTDLAPFDYLKRDPEQMKALGHIMVLDAVQYWVTDYPVVETVGSFQATPENALLVDVGGGFGTHSIAFKKKFPDLQGRIVVQDLQSTLMHIPEPKPEGIEFQEHDFFSMQPIRGAKFYYMRHILHDWPDKDCVRILQSLIPAMSKDSLILLDEVVLPETKVPWQVSAMTISMMACLGGIERTREDWEKLLDSAGLKVVDVNKYDESKFHSIVAAVPK